ncbi:armadillo-type protein [Myxozyma melibiosi]|uniref:Armadillo-type protein n=1 Tax=Myxozyma melibiosi TaxID=54550 RepID=A0ABR1F117_9ASCO
MSINPVELFHALQAAALQDPASEPTRKAAEKQLKTWETHAGFYSLLQDAFLDESLPTEIRWISIIYFKNGIDKYWRKSAPHALSKEEKQQIRSKIPQTYGVYVPQLGAQNALAVARIARLDFPVEWPSLFSDNLGLAKEAYEKGDLTRLKSILVVVNQVVKTLSSTRFGKTRGALQQAAPGVVRFIGHWCFEFMRQWLNNEPSTYSPEELAIRAEIGYLSLKICRRLVTEGYDFANRSAEASEFYQATTIHLSIFLEKYAAHPTEVLEKHIKTLGKFYQDLAERQPTAFIMLPGTFNLIKLYLSVFQSQAASFHLPEFENIEFWEKVLVRGLLLFRKCIKMIFGDGMSTIKYRTPEDRAETKEAVGKLKQELCTDSFIVQVHDIVLWSYLRLRPVDLEKWSYEPEEFVYDEIQNSWEYQLRPCSEKVYIDLLANFKDLLKPRILEAFNNVSNSADMSDDALLTKDAVYCAFSITSSALFEDVDFDKIFEQILAPQVMHASADSPPMLRIIFRRIAIIISDWVSVKCGQQTRKIIYDVLARLLDPSLPLNDLVVQLSAASALKSAVDEWDFKLEDFLPYLELFLTRIMEMMNKMEMIETKLALLQVISVIVEVSEMHILAYADSIIAVLPSLWDQAGDEHILKGAILHTLTVLINGVGRELHRFQPLFMPLIGSIVDPNSSLHVYLLEDALELWQSAIKNATAASPELLSLVPALITSLDNATDNLRIELSILEGYVKLEPAFVQQEYGKTLFTILASFIGSLKVEACQTVTRILEIFMQRLPITSYINEFVETGLLARMTNSIFDAHESAINVAGYLTIYARLAIADPNVVVQFCDMYGPQRQSPPSGGSCLGPLLDTWVEKSENMGHPRMRRMTAMGLDALLNSPVSGQRDEVVGRRATLADVRDQILAEQEGGDEVELDVEKWVQRGPGTGYGSGY